MSVEETDESMLEGVTLWAVRRLGLGLFDLDSGSKRLIRRSDREPCPNGPDQFLF